MLYRYPILTEELATTFARYIPDTPHLVTYMDHFSVLVANSLPPGNAVLLSDGTRPSIKVRNELNTRKCFIKHNYKA